MKKIIYIFTAIIGLTFGACSPDDVTINPLEPTEPLLVGAMLNTPDVTNFDVIQTTDNTEGNENDEAVEFTWEAAEGDNDGDILYYVQMDVSGNGFKTAVTIPLAEPGTTELFRNLTFGQLNDATNQISENLLALASALSINFGESNLLDVRVQTILGASIAVGYSEVLNITVTPYFTGLSDQLLIDGDALAESVLLVNTDGIFKGRVELTANTFRFFAEPADTGISYNYSYFESRGYTIDPLLENANDTEMNFNFTGNAGPWDIYLNTLEKTISLIEVTAPDNLFAVGSIVEWNPENAIPFTNNGDNTFSVVLNLIDTDEFKFLETIGVYEGDWGADPNNPGFIIQEGEDNIKSPGNGWYLVNVNFNTLQYTLTEVNNLYLVGTITDPQWDPSAALPMSKSSVGVFSIAITAQAGDEFKFLPTNTGWDGDFGEDPNNPGKGFDGDGEKNISIETAGDYIVSYNYNNNTISISSIVFPTELYLVGSFRGWNNDVDNPKFTETLTGVFEVTQAFAADDEFKFVKSNTGGDWANDMGQNKTHPMVLEQNDENNIKITTAGTYTVTVNFNNGTIKISM